VYALTSDGRDLLEAWAMTLELNRTILGRFLERYAQLETGSPASPSPGMPLVISAPRATLRFGEASS
jgi:hypothetical protein